MTVLFLLHDQTLTFTARALSLTEVRWTRCCVVHAHLLVPVLSGEVWIGVGVCRCRCTFDGVCSSLVLHRFPILRDVGNSRCHYVECSVFFFLFAPRWFAMGAVLFLNELHVCKIDTEGGVRFHQDRCGFKRTKRLKRSHFQHCAHRFATGLVLSFNVSDCDDSSHMFDAFGDVFRCGYLQYLDCQCGVRCKCGTQLLLWCGRMCVVAKRRQMMTQTTSSSTELKRV